MKISGQFPQLLYKSKDFQFIFHGILHKLYFSVLKITALTVKPLSRTVFKNIFYAVTVDRTLPKVADIFPNVPAYHIVSSLLQRRGRIGIYSMPTNPYPPPFVSSLSCHLPHSACILLHFPILGCVNPYRSRIYILNDLTIFKISFSNTTPPPPHHHHISSLTP